MTTAVVFAYHNVGVRCLAVLLEAGINVRLVVTHADNPRENIWFESVAALAAAHQIPTIKPASGDSPALAKHVQAIAPDLIFSFYYRHMLPAQVLAHAKRGAYNMHGSLLPKYRGRVPINWAIIHGETESGVTLHEMVAQPDAGRIVDQMTVPILTNDTALVLFNKVTVAAECVLARSLAALAAGRARLTPQILAQGSYFGGRQPDDGRIDWAKPGRDIHNLIRAVAPPYPGAFCEATGTRLVLTGSRWIGPSTASRRALLERVNGKLIGYGVDGGAFEVLGVTAGGMSLSAARVAKRYAQCGKMLS